MPTITINSNDYFSFASVADSNVYLTPISSEWIALSDEVKGGYLIRATRYMESLPWTSACGTTNEDRATRANIVAATIEIAYLIFTDSAPFLSSSGAESQGVKRLKADVAEIEYQSTWQMAKFGSNIFFGLPTRILKMLPPCISIATNNSAGGALSFNTDTELPNTDFSYTVNLGRF